MRLAYILLIGLLGLCSLAAVSEARMARKDIPPRLPISTQSIRVDVFRRERDLLKITSHWPDSLIVENVSDKEVSAFSIEMFAANDDGGPGREVRWGQTPDYAKQNPLFKPKEVLTLQIKPEIVRTFQENNKPLLYIQLAEVWINNDPVTMYKYGAELRQDQNNPKRYVVVVDANGRPRN